MSPHNVKCVGVYQCSVVVHVPAQCVCLCGLVVHVVTCRYKPQPGVAVVMCPQTHAQVEQSVARAITMSSMIETAKAFEFCSLIGSHS